MTPPTTGHASWRAVAIVVVLAALAPLVFTDFFVSVILTKSLWLGIAAASLIFLSAYGGMVSLAQVGIYGVAGMTFANLVLADGGAAAAWSPWIATIAALLVATLVGLGFGAIAARSVGIYFLMITLAFSVLVFYFFSQVTELSGFGGVNNVDLPGTRRQPRPRPGPALLHDPRRCGARLPRPALRRRARRSGWPSRACATSPTACARSAST